MKKCEDCKHELRHHYKVSWKQNRYCIEVTATETTWTGIYELDTCGCREFVAPRVDTAPAS